MRLELPGTTIYHDYSQAFPLLLEATRRGQRVIGAWGPIYREDPAAEVVASFKHSAEETGWDLDESDGPQFMPEWAFIRSKRLRQAAVDSWVKGSIDQDLDELDRWTRAGMVLEIARLRGVRVKGLGLAKVRWSLKGTETGRFGATPWGRSAIWPNGFNPLTIPNHQRDLVLPSSDDRFVCAIDFRAIDLVSMTKIVPGLAARYEDCDDLHARTVELLFGKKAASLVPEARDMCKREVFVHAYGGESRLRRSFEEMIPELQWLRDMPDGQGPRAVQSLSARAFRSGLAAAMPLLLSQSVMPMFAVHDELVIDVHPDSLPEAMHISSVIESGASLAVGATYTTKVKWGRNYMEAKRA